MVQDRISACEVQSVPVCTALKVRMWGPTPNKSDPAWVRKAITDACRHNEISCMSVKDDKPITRNDHRARSTYLLQEAVRYMMRHQLLCSLYRNEQDRIKRAAYKPCYSKRDVLLKLEMAWNYYKEWDYG